MSRMQFTVAALALFVATANAVCTNSSKFDDQTGALCTVPVNYGHPTLSTEGGDLVLKLQDGKRFGIDYNRGKVNWFPDAFKKPIDKALATIAEAAVVTDGKSEQLKADTNEELTARAIDEREAEFIIILTNPRSASTSVAHAIGSHVCATSFNEVYGNSQRYSSGLLPSEHGCIESLQCEFVSGGCDSQKWKNRHNDLLGTYKETRRAWCKRERVHPQSPWPSCGKTCVVSSKIHGVQFKQHEHEKREQLKQLLAYAGTRVVVVERKNTDKLQCSLRYSHTTGVWHDVNKTAYKRWKQRNCRGHEDATFKQDQDEWFTWLHDTMAELHKPYLNMSYKEYVSNPRQAEVRLQTFSGLRLTHAIREDCLNGCNC